MTKTCRTLVERSGSGVIPLSLQQVGKVEVGVGMAKLSGPLVPPHGFGWVTVAIKLSP